MAQAKIDKEITVEDKLYALYELQKVASKIDEITILRGELPLEVQDLEDEIIGLTTRIEHFENQITDYTSQISLQKVAKEEAKIKVKRFTEQLNHIRNNRELEILQKEIENKNLDIELCDKEIAEFKAAIGNKTDEQKNTATLLAERRLDLEQKTSELDNIINETKQDEEKLIEQAKEIETRIEPRLLTAFHRIRDNARNGLAVVYVERDACGGCFNQIPAQRQLDIKNRKKVLVCEYCGRILVDKELADDINKKEI